MKIIKTLAAFLLVLTVAVSAITIIAAAETSASQDESSTVVIFTDVNGSTREYQLEWRYYETSEHLYKRRWNCTLGEWYDPKWILVW